MTRKTMTNFTAGDMLGSIKDRPSGEKPKESPKPAPAPKAEPKADANKVPEGTSSEILDWVGDDPSRARKAISAEKKSDNPRVTLLEPLQRIVDEDKQAKKEAAAKKAAEKQGE